MSSTNIIFPILGKDIKYGMYEFIGDGITTLVTIPHGFAETPAFVNLINLNPLTTNFLTRTITWDNINIFVSYGSAPLTDEIAHYSWFAIK